MGDLDQDQDQDQETRYKRQSNEMVMSRFWSWFCSGNGKQKTESGNVVCPGSTGSDPGE
jgi:hypothetical protein